MNVKTTMTLLTLLALACAPVASAQEPAGASRGQDNEFGSIRTPYTIEVNGQPADIEAKVVLRKNYDDKDSRFFMFAWSVQNTPLTVDFTNLVRADNGAEMPCYKRESDNGQIKCFVDLKDMPPVGTEIVMKGSVGSKKDGSFQVGAIVVPFTYTWTRVPQTNGLDAELYGDTLVNVQHCTQTKCGLGGGGSVFGVPGPGAAAAVGALAVVAVGLALLRRKKAP